MGQHIDHDRHASPPPPAKLSHTQKLRICSGLKGQGVKEQEVKGQDVKNGASPPNADDELSSCRIKSPYTLAQIKEINLLAIAYSLRSEPQSRNARLKFVRELLSREGLYSHLQRIAHSSIHDDEKQIAASIRIATRGLMQDADRENRTEVLHDILGRIARATDQDKMALIAGWMKLFLPKSAVYDFLTIRDLFLGILSPQPISRPTRRRIDPRWQESRSPVRIKHE